MSKTKSIAKRQANADKALVERQAARKAAVKAADAANTVWIVGTAQRVTFRNPAKLASFCERMKATGVKVHVGSKLPEKEKINAPS